MPTREIKLGDQTFSFTVPLTIGQLIEANIGMALPASPDPKEEARRGFQRVLDVVLSAIKAENPDVTAEKILAIRGVTIRELNAAARVAFEESGLITRSEAEPEGEAQAEAA